MRKKGFRQTIIGEISDGAIHMCNIGFVPSLTRPPDKGRNYVSYLTTKI